MFSHLENVACISLLMLELLETIIRIKIKVN